MRGDDDTDDWETAVIPNLAPTTNKTSNTTNLDNIINNANKNNQLNIVKIDDRLLDALGGQERMGLLRMENALIDFINSNEIIYEIQIHNTYR